ncbi:MAG: hypothetical protein ACKVX7_03495 [Planctomycetota bacterium]
MVLLFVGLISLASCDWLPVRLRRVSERERAEEQLAASRDAERRGAWARAEALAVEACRIDPSLFEAWLDRVDAARRRGASERGFAERVLREEFTNGIARAPAEPQWWILRGLVALDPDTRADAWRVAWREAHAAAASEQSPGFARFLLDPRQLRFETLSEWRDYARMLSTLEPRTPALRVRLGLTLVELGDVAALEALRREVAPSEAAAFAVVRAALALRAGDVERVLELLDQAPEPRPVEHGLLRVETLIAQSEFGRAQSAIEESRGRHGSVGEHEILTVRIANLRGHAARAESLVRALTDNIVLPRYRVERELLTRALTTDAARAEVTASLVRAVNWCTSAREVAEVEALALSAGSTEALQVVLDWHIGRAPSDDEAAIVRRLARVLAEPRFDAARLKEWWAVVNCRDAVRRAERFQALDVASRGALAAFLCEQPDAELRVFALRRMRDDRSIPFSAATAALASVDDEVVRGAYLALALAQGGDIARTAREWGRADRSSYVREIAGAGAADGQ